MKQNQLIWESEVDWSEWEDYIKEMKEENPDITDDEIDRVINDLNGQYLDDERENLSHTFDTTIICVASLGLWSGRVSAYKVIGHRLQDVLYDDNDFVMWFCDRYNLCGEAHHHDGRNYYTYRLMKNDDDLEKVTRLIYNGEMTPALLTKYTKSLRPYVAQVYGY